MNQPIKCYLSHPHACSYLPDRMACSIVIDPQLPINQHLYSRLAQLGFRRSGEQIYKPQCETCKACIPLRILAQKFLPNRNQRRIWNKNQDLSTKISKAGFEPVHFELYRRYLQHQHRGGGMDQNVSEKSYMDFLTCSGINNAFVEFYLDETLLAVAVVDELDDALSAVYTFYDPAYKSRSLGTYAILWQIEHARSRHLNWLYLGYWIQQCRKMSYKNKFRPCELLIEGQWQ